MSEDTHNLQGLIVRCKAHHLQNKKRGIKLIAHLSHHPQIIQEFLVSLTRYDQVSISTPIRECARLGQSGIWRSFNGELCVVINLFMMTFLPFRATKPKKNE